MAETTLVVPLVRLAGCVLEGIWSYRELDDSVKSFVQQVEQLYDSLKVLQNTVQDRTTKRSRYSRLDDPVEQQLANLVKNIRETHKATESFFQKNGIRKPEEGQSIWNTNIVRTGWNIFQQESIRRRLGELQQHYHFHYIQISLVSHALHLQTLQEFSPPQGPLGRSNSIKSDRLHDPKLLTRARTMASMSNTPSIYENWANEPSPAMTFASPSENYYNGPALSEDRLRYEFQDEYTESQRWLFEKFQNEMRQQPISLQDIQLSNLLNKIVFWLSKCDTIWPAEVMAYTITWVHLMKAAWLLSEIMLYVPHKRIASHLNERYLVEIQNKIIACHPMGREPPEPWALKRLPGDMLLLRLTDEQGDITPPTIKIDTDFTDTEPIENDDEPVGDEQIAFQRTVKNDYSNARQRLVKVIRHRNDFSSTTTVGEIRSDAIAIVEETSYIQNDHYTLHPSEDAEGFQHAITGYDVKQTIVAQSSSLCTRSSIGWAKLTEFKTTNVQIWRPEPLKRTNKSSTSFLQPPPQSPQGRRQGPWPTQGQNRQHQGAPRSSVLPDLPAGFFPDALGSPRASQFSGGSTNSQASQASVTINMLDSPECAKVLVYGRADNSVKQLIVLALDEKIAIDEYGCCTQKANKKADDGDILCCANVSVYSNPGVGGGAAGEVNLYSGDTDSIFTDKSHRDKESARIALSLNARDWNSGGKRIKFKSIMIRFRTKPDKRAFMDSFMTYRGLYLADLVDFRKETQDRRRRHDH
ncbi:hypothetical protein ABW19_dt0201428 [Dactylella cylindrospora]|nr:hypothetical protein ABW19_dt0201428 [Dactylella cylindrospora]